MRSWQYQQSLWCPSLYGHSHGKRGSHERSNHNIGDPANRIDYMEAAEERGMDVILNDENIAERKRQLDVINMIPSNKFDDVPLNNLSDQAMSDFDAKHLRDLHDQVMAYDDEELKCVSEALVERGWTYLYNALGDYFEKIVKQREKTKEINQ